MNLLTKVLLTLILIISVGMLTVSLLVQRSANTAYEGYLGEAISRRLTDMAVDAGAIYAQTGSWSQTQAWVDQSSSSYLTGNPGVGNSNGRGVGQRGRGGNGPVATDVTPAAGITGMVLLVDPATGELLSEPGAPGLDPSQAAIGAPVLVDGEEVARLVDTRSTQSAIVAAIGPAEQAFLDRIDRALAISSLVAGVVALILGGLLVYSLLKPLRSLEEGVLQVAAGNLDTQVDIHSRDEIGQLAAGFNRMAVNLHRQEELRQRLVADIAHELRTPLSVIQGNLQALLDDVYPLTKEEIGTVHQETRVLSRLIQDLHELAQAEAGRLPLAVQTLDAGEVARHMVSIFRPLAESRGITVTLIPPGEAPLPFQGDPDRIQQILHNLMGNALRHTHEGGEVRLGARLVGFGEKGEKMVKYAVDDYTKAVRFTITNNGPSIPAQDLPHIFDRFYRGDPSRVRAETHTSGSGLGLAIVKALVEAQAGQVGVESAPGQGTSFWFELPGG